MALTDTDGMNTTMLVSPAAGMNNGFGGFGGDGWWILLLFLFAGGGMWGNNWGGGFGGFNNQLSYDFPWLINGQNNINANTNSGFRDAMLNDGINGIRDGIAGVSTQLCNGFATTNATINSGFANAETAANARQIANMQTAFNAQTAVTGELNNLAMGLQNCCCENRANIADLKYTVATENCADRAAISDGIRDLLAATQAQTQAILTQLCNDKIESKNDTIAQLRQELIYARGQASQVAQTADIRANNATVANQLVAELRSCPIPSQPVYGNQPIFTCPQSSGCGCGAI